MTIPEKCKCCNSGSLLFLGNLDANRACWDRYGTRVFPISEEMLAYYSCQNCGFIFTNHTDNWSADQFKLKIYNQDYLNKVNPPLPQDVEKPLMESGGWLKGKQFAYMLEGSQKQIRILDYGAGSDIGTTGQALIDSGFDYSAYDPHFSDSKKMPNGEYDFIFAIEVIEHCHNLDELTNFINKHLSKKGIFYIETLIHPFPAPPEILNSWYIAPRDGHISIFSFEAIAALFRGANLNFAKTLYGMLVFKSLPDFPNKFFV